MDLDSQWIGHLFRVIPRQDPDHRGKPPEDLALRDTVRQVLGTNYRDFSLLESDYGITVLVNERDRFKAQNRFEAFMRQLQNQWNQGALKRQREAARPAGTIEDLQQEYEDPSYAVAPAPAAPLTHPDYHPLSGVLSASATQHKQDPAPGVYQVGNPSAMPKAMTETGSAPASWDQHQYQPRPGLVLQNKLVSTPDDDGTDDDYCDDDEPEEPPLAPLSAEQQKVYDDIFSGTGHVFLTGKAGTGKSHLLKHLVKSGRVKVCATTARAAMLVGGCTVDRLFQMKRGANYTCMNNHKLDDYMRNSPSYIAVDEGSMVGLKMADYILKTAKGYKKTLIIVGDLAQASPVMDEFFTKSELFKGIVANQRFYKLTESHRQSEKPLLDALDSLRGGEVTDHVTQLFAPCIVDSVVKDDRYIRLYCTNAAASSYNEERLRELPTIGRTVTLQAKLTDMRDLPLQKAWPLTDDAIMKALDESRLAHDERFKKNCRILVTMNQVVTEKDKEDWKNLSDSQKKAEFKPAWVNGDQGVLEDILFSDGTVASETPEETGVNLAAMFSAPAPTDAPAAPPAPKIPVGMQVRLDRTGGLVTITRATEELVDPADRVIHEISGFPVRLGWAITVHKSQGMSVDHALFDMASTLRMIGESKHGLAYVAMSRTRTLAGLKIINWSPKAVYCSPEVQRWI